jgi:hypothetical protein
MLTLAFGELYWKRNKWDRPTAAVEGEVIGVLYRLEMIERKKSEKGSEVTDSGGVLLCHFFQLLSGALL